MLEDAGQEVTKAAESLAIPGRKSLKLEPGLHVVYARDLQRRICSVGRVSALTKAECSVQVHKYVSRWGAGLRVHWVPLYLDSEGVETTQSAGGRPSLEGITRKQVLDIVQLDDGVLNHAMARKLDRGG